MSIKALSNEKIKKADFCNDGSIYRGIDASFSDICFRST